MYASLPKALPRPEYTACPQFYNYMVLGIRPEFIEISQTGGLDGEIYGAMPTGMESTIKIRVGDYLLTGVVFGSTLFRLGTKVRVKTGSENIMLFDRQSGECIALGALEFE